MTRFLKAFSRPALRQWRGLLQGRLWWPAGVSIYRHQRHSRLVGLSFFLLCFSTSASAQVADLSRQSSHQQILKVYYRLWTLPAGSPVFQKTADSSRRHAEAIGDERLALYTRLIAAERKTAIMGKKALAETPLFKEKTVMEAAPYPDVAALYSYYSGVYYEAARDYGNAFRHMISAIETFEKIGWRNVPLAVFITYYLFETYYHYGDYPTAIRFAQLSLENSDGGSFRPTHVLSSMGEAYLKMKDLPKAQALFQQVVQMASKNHDTAYIGIATGNYGNTLRLQGLYREALPYFYTEVDLNERRVAENSAINCAYIAHCLLQLDSVEKAGIYLQKAYRLKIDYYWSWAPFYLAYYDAAAGYHKRKADYRQASLYQDSLLAVKDSLREKFNTSILLTTSLTLKEQKRLAGLQQKELEAANIRLTRNMVIGVMALLFGLAMAAFFRKRQWEQQQFLARQQQSEEKLQKAEGELAHYLATLREKNRLIERIESQLERNTAAGGGTTDADEKVQIAFEGLSLLTDTDWHQFRSLFSAAHPQFLLNLESRYPGLSPAETRLVVLQKLQLSSKETAAMLGISLESLRKSRYRLRKKYPALMQEDEGKTSEPAGKEKKG